MVVQGHIPHQGLLQILAAVKAVRLEHICNAPIETLDHAIGSGRPGFGQSVFNAQGLAQLIKLVLTRGLALSARKESVRELLAVVGQQLLNPERAGLVQGAEKGLRAGRRLVLLDRHEHPALGPVNGHEQVAPLRLVGHLRQVFHVHVQVARLIALEALVRLTGRARLERIEVAQSMAAQAAIQSGAGGLGTDELSRDGQQIVQWEQQRAAQLHDHALLGGCEGGLQAVRRVRAVQEAGALLPFVDGGLSDAKALGKAGGTVGAGGNLGTDGRRGARILVQGNHHGSSPAGCMRLCTSSLMAALAMNNGYRLESMQSSGMRQLKILK